VVTSVPATYREQLVSRLKYLTANLSCASFDAPELVIASSAGSTPHARYSMKTKCARAKCRKERCSGREQMRCTVLGAASGLRRMSQKFRKNREVTSTDRGYRTQREFQAARDGVGNCRGSEREPRRISQRLRFNHGALGFESFGDAIPSPCYYLPAVIHLNATVTGRERAAAMPVVDGRDEVVVIVIQVQFSFVHVDILDHAIEVPKARTLRDMEATWSLGWWTRKAAAKFNA